MGVLDSIKKLFGMGSSSEAMDTVPSQEPQQPVMPSASEPVENVQPVSPDQNAQM